MIYIHTVILKSTHPDGKLDYESLIWEKRGCKTEKKLDYSIKIITISICKPMKITMAHY